MSISLDVCMLKQELVNPRCACAARVLALCASVRSSNYIVRFSLQPTARLFLDLSSWIF